MSDRTDSKWGEILKCFTRGDRAKAFWRMTWTGGVSVQSNRIGKALQSKRGRKIIAACDGLSTADLDQLVTRAQFHRKMTESDARAVLVPALTLPVAMMAFIFEFLGDSFREDGNYELFGAAIVIAVFFGLIAYFNGVIKTQESEELEAILTLEQKKREAPSPSAE
ncbi:hypothetical protein ABI59_10635 [Acidobacteria bacterium Mor1]|nr:hypothetical protein ABI59_10635 [Acidobacteria bacterium Mor1]